MAGLQGAQPFLYEEDCTSNVEISVSCSGLPKMDLFSKSDPFVTLYLREGKSYKKIGVTEVKNNTHEPKFDKVFELAYHFEEEQIMKFVVEDYDRIGKNDYIGATHVRLGELASSGEPMVYELKDNGKSRGTITLYAEEGISNKAKVTFYTRCTKLDKKDFFGKSDPYFEIRKIREGNRPVLVYKSAVIKSNLNPVFDPFDIGMSALCSGDYNTPLQFDVFDWNMSGKVDLIGSFRTSFAEISPEHGSINSFTLINPDIKRKKGNKYKNSGTFTFSRIIITPVHTFVEYLKGGLQIQLIVAIDFTGSNGNPADPRSLHHIGVRDNEYLEAIKSVGNILVPYDSDQQIPCFGFGAKLPPAYDRAHHCFPLNGKADPEVNGIQGIIDAYKYTLSSCRLSGPTLFSEILAYSKAVAESQMEEYAYTILLIITDGVINDMRQSSDLIVESSTLPLSIVIVGVGGADFTDMNTLDADDIPLVHSRTLKRMKNDIVQFVPLREVKQSSTTQFNLAKEVLEEVPGQVTKYMSDYNIKPKPPVARMFNAPAISSLEDIRAATQTPPNSSTGYTSPYPGQQQSNPMHASVPSLAHGAQFNPVGYPLQQPQPKQYQAKYAHPQGMAPPQWGYQAPPAGYPPPASPYGFQNYGQSPGPYAGPPGGNPPYPTAPPH
ncbi:copine-9 [Oopsacas minuta]|uniref:Copine-9 n=1 Tax=Oopsacas minuta TaxID=111878 RepID=A0AAV7JNJ5_9METZ|nr:copine-9 [Oopsacas minuta]